MSELTLEDVAEVESLSRAQYYKLMTGKAISHNFPSTLVDEPVNVNESNMLQVLEATRKTTYHLHLKNMENAYEAGDYDDFRQQVMETLLDISWD